MLFVSVFYMKDAINHCHNTLFINLPMCPKSQSNHDVVLCLGESVWCFSSFFLGVDLFFLNFLAIDLFLSYLFLLLTSFLLFILTVDLFSYLGGSRGTVVARWTAG